MRMQPLQKLETKNMGECKRKILNYQYLDLCTDQVLKAGREDGHLGRMKLWMCELELVFQA
jgi:hypothetical protein